MGALEGVCTDLLAPLGDEHTAAGVVPGGCFKRASPHTEQHTQHKRRKLGPARGARHGRSPASPQPQPRGQKGGTRGAARRVRFLGRAPPPPPREPGAALTFPHTAHTTTLPIQAGRVEHATAQAGERDRAPTQGAVPANETTRKEREKMGRAHPPPPPPAPPPPRGRPTPTHGHSHFAEYAGLGGGDTFEARCVAEVGSM